MGLYKAGFKVDGVDISDQPRYPFNFIKSDALKISTQKLKEYDFIWASPPCQAYSKTQKIRGREHPDLIGAIRWRLNRLGIPYVIENVMGAPLVSPILLCGSMFGIKTYRHRIFETSFKVAQPWHPEHNHRTAKMGRPPKRNEFMHIVGNFSGVDQARKIMDMPWASRDGLREAIPPVYSKWIADQFLSTHQPKRGN